MKRRKFLLGAAVATVGLGIPTLINAMYSKTIYENPTSGPESVYFHKYATNLILMWEQDPDRIVARMTTPDGKEYVMGALLNVKPFDNKTRRKMLIRSAKRTLENKYGL